MDFDQLTITLLIRRPDAPQLSVEEVARLQDGHMAHLADLHEAGHLLAAGPVLSGADGELRGLSILNVDPARALELKSTDPAVRAGLYTVQAHPWLVPAGAMTFAPAHFPRRMAEVAAP